MNSYIRQTPAVPADQMHSFLKDKQAWENAIAMYQGPDPLDHWYNYVCWYENNGHGDPENKFRETLERCLTLYEHSDYYKQDPRMVRLWLKYIDMQMNPLDFYKVLYQRGVGRQLAAFYVSWAEYYESINALKEAESVFSLAFQEKAQPYDELNHAYNKLLYARSMAAAAQQKAAMQLPQQQQQQQHNAVQYAQQQPQQAHGLPQQQEHEHLQQAHQVQSQTYRQHIAYQQQQQQQPQLSHSHQQPQQQHLPHVQIPLAQQQEHIYQQHINYQQQMPHNLPQQQQEQLQHLNSHHQAQQHSHTHAHLQQHLEQSELQQQLHLRQQLLSQQQHVTNELNDLNSSAAAATYDHAACAVATTANTSASSLTPYEQQLPAASASMGMEQCQCSHSPQTESNLDQQQQQTVVETPIEGIKLPRKFSSFCRNNFETWTPALFLEEPPDPNRRCHYAKELVYPENITTEYSPEEIRARKYTGRLELLKRREVQQAQQAVPEPQTTVRETVVQLQHIQEIGSDQQLQQLQQEDQPAYNKLNHPNYSNDSTLADTAAVDESFADGEDGEENNVDGDAAEAENGDGAEDDAEADADEDEGEEEDDEEEQVNKNATRLQEHGRQRHHHHTQPNHHNHYQQQHQHHQQQHRAATNVVVNTVDDLEEQIEASTIRFSQNKTIKIKFKKERPQDGVSLNNSNYSAYTVESIYQPEIESPAFGQEPAIARKNGHSFHPYNLGHTSTPKSSSSKRHKTKLKHVNKFQLQVATAAVTYSSSNSSSNTENGMASGGAAVSAGNGNAAGERLECLHGYNNGAPTAVHNASFNDNANYSFSSAVALENSNCSLSSAVGRLNFRESTAVQANNTSTAGGVDISTYQENSYFATQHDTEAKERRLQKSLESIKCHLGKEAIDPFNSELCKAFLTKLDFPGTDDEAHANYKILQTPLPKIANTRNLSLPDGLSFSIDKEVGRGSYGSVYKATDTNNGSVVALKFQKPPNTWEIYICDQVLKRVQSPSVLPGLMDISTAIIAPNASLIATEFSQYGSLLDINNKIRQATSKVMHESLVMHFSAQICQIIQQLHKHKIIHADIKPDNFLLMRIPNTDLHYPSLRLIDFGCAIDMTLFPDPERTKFRKVIQTDGFTCIEMQEGRPWSYETDLFCIAGTVHVMLMGEYMQLQKRDSTWDIKQKLPRYLKKHVWTHFFHDMLNIKSNKLPDLKQMRSIFSEEAAKMDSELQSQIRMLSNILHRR